MMMNVIVGSQNPVKLSATRSIFTLVFSDPSIIGVEGISEVPAQPWGDVQTRLGAYNRARNALEHGGEFGVGFEGGVTDTEHGLMSCAWCCVVGPDGRHGFGGGVYMILPARVETLLREGVELGTAMDYLVNQEGTKKREGAVGILTNGLLSRQKAYESILAMALTPFIRPEYYS